MLRRCLEIGTVVLGLAANSAESACYLTDSGGNAVVSAHGIKWEHECASAFAIQLPGAKASGELILRFQTWMQQVVNATPARQKPVVPTCASPENDGVWLLSPASTSAGPIRTCQVKAGATLLFPAISELSIGGRDKCADMVRAVREEVQRHGSDFSVYIEGALLEPGAFWGNSSLDCFPLNTGWDGFAVQRAGEDKAHYLTHAYSDGYWVLVTFDTPGVYALRVVQHPHQRWRWKETYSLDVTYTIRVTD